MKVIFFLLLVCACLSGCVNDREIYTDYGKLACNKVCPDIKSLLWPSVIHFDFDKSNITAAEKSKLDQVAKVLKQRSSFNIAIIGATDPTGTVEYNNALSLRRSEVVGNYLQTQGIANSRMVLIGTGEHELFLKTNNKQKNVVNRRTYLILLDANHNPVDLYFNQLSLPSEPLMMNKVNSL
ncbi:OmpA family protein [Photobacterium kishitanii]|uniref:OmpA family protein n=1 Tax=Photobacterium kishitanii TaxID=318456 RepID=UPI000D161EAF|nr:OmpA family protein [Photobacterium kishitanii]PSV15598.1 OmpA family protein [Photobacterium kishitanii]